MTSRRALLLGPTLALAQSKATALFDGNSFAGWRAPLPEIAIEECWRIAEGCLETIPDAELPHGLSTDIWTAGNYTSFDLRFEYWAEPRGNGGLKYQVQKAIYVEDIAGKQRVIESFEQQPGARVIGYSVALEYQVSAPDEPAGLKSIAARAGALYNKKGPPEHVVAKAGEWNAARVRVEPKGMLRHWLNGDLAMETQLFDPLRPLPIALQHHGTRVRYRQLILEALA